MEGVHAASGGGARCKWRGCPASGGGVHCKWRGCALQLEGVRCKRGCPASGGGGAASGGGVRAASGGGARCNWKGCLLQLEGVHCKWRGCPPSGRVPSKWKGALQVEGVRAATGRDVLPSGGGALQVEGGARLQEMMEESFPPKFDFSLQEA